MTNKDFFLFNKNKYSVDDKKNNFSQYDLNRVCEDITLIKSYRIPKLKTKISYGTIGDKHCFLVVCSTEFNSDKQHVYIEMRDILDLKDVEKICYIIYETYKANINNRTKEKHSA